MNLKNIFRKKVIAKKSWLGNIKTFFEKYRLAILIYQLVFRIYLWYITSNYKTSEKKVEIDGSYVRWNIKDNLLYWCFDNTIPEIIILIINIINEIKEESIIDTKYLNMYLLLKLLLLPYTLVSILIRVIFKIDKIGGGSLTQNVTNLFTGTIIDNPIIQIILWVIWHITNLFLAAYTINNNYSDISYSYRFVLYSLYIDIMIWIGSKQNIKAKEMLGSFVFKFKDKQWPFAFWGILHSKITMPFFLPWILKKIQSAK